MRDIFQLRNVVFVVVAEFSEQREVFQILLAGMSGVKLIELPEHHSPSAHLLCCEVDVGNWLPADKTKG